MPAGLLHACVGSKCILQTGALLMHGIDIHIHTLNGPVQCAYFCRRQFRLRVRKALMQ